MGHAKVSEVEDNGVAPSHFTWRTRGGGKGAPCRATALSQQPYERSAGLLWLCAEVIFFHPRRMGAQKASEAQQLDEQGVGERGGILAVHLLFLCPPSSHTLDPDGDGPASWQLQTGGGGCSDGATLPDVKCEEGERAPLPPLSPAPPAAVAPLLRACAACYTHRVAVGGSNEVQL